MHFGRAAQRVDHAGELDEQAVASRLDDPATVLGSSRRCAFRRARPFLIGADQPAVSRDICGEDGGRLAFDAFPSQSGAP